MVTDESEEDYPQSQPADHANFDEDMEFAEARLVYSACGRDRPDTDTQYHAALEADSTAFAT